MEEESVSVAWGWVIEALARSDLVDAPLLYELCRSISHDTDMGIAAREAAALTCLQALYPPPKHDVPHSQICLHPAHTCQHLLHRIWLETGNLQKDASDELKWGVQTFVNHKKASFPNSTLQLLKDMIVQGNHSVFKEISGLVFGDQCGLDVPSSKCGQQMYPQATSANFPHLRVTLHQQVNTCNPASEVDDQLRDAGIFNTSAGESKTGINGSCTDNHMQEVNITASRARRVHTCNPASEVDDQLRDARIFNTSAGQSKTGINGSCIDNHMKEVDISASPDQDNIGPPVKKLKLQNQCDMPPKQQVSVSFDVAKLPDGIRDESNDPPTEANHTCGGESKKIVAKTFQETDNLPLRSPDSGGCHPQHTDATMSKAIFSDSQGGFSEDSITLTDTEENLCMKCNKGGQLLSCCGSTCPLHFHKACLGCFVSFDDGGDFYCPVCAYSRAAADFVKAKERVSAARKELALFIGGGSNDQPKHKHNKSSNDD